MKILITGSGGQLGTALQAELRRHEIIALSHAELDICDFGATRDAVNAHRPAIVMNAAAYTAVDAAETDAAGAYRLNSLAPRNLAIATQALGIPLVHVSTDYVFDGRGERPYHEYDATNPQSIYGKSKLAGEQAVAAHNPMHYIVRTAWLYHVTGRNFPWTMLTQAEKPEVRVVSDQYGSPTFAPHLAAAIHRLIETGAYGAWHMAGSGGTSWFELTRQLYERAKIRTAVLPVATTEYPRPAPRPRYSILTSLQEPRIALPPWQEGLAEFVKNIAEK